MSNVFVAIRPLQVVVLLWCVIAFSAFADGMVPETTVIVLDEGEGEVTINVKNTDSVPNLLHSSIENIPEDQELLVFVTPPIARVEPGEKQLVRFIGQFSQPLKTQRLRRAIFEGIKPKKVNDKATVGVTLRQNLPLVIHPKDLEKNPTPWTLLQWQVVGERLQIRNDSPYVVRLSQLVLLAPQNQQIDIARTYVLPGEVLYIHVGVSLSGTTGVTFYPATVYGFTVESYYAPVVRQN